MKTLNFLITTKMNMKNHIFSLLLLTISPVVLAAEKRVEHEAHQHGVAEINIVWDSSDLNIELLSPAFNITGFENQPANHEQEEEIERIEKKLNEADELFSFIGASCKSVKIEVESPFETHDDHANHEEHRDEKEHKNHKHVEHADHDDHKKDDDHKDHKDHEEHVKHDDNEKHDDHDDHDHDEHESTTHSAYEISYEFTCANSKSEINIVMVNLFNTFPNMEKIKVQWLSATQQSSYVLTKKTNIITLK